MSRPLAYLPVPGLWGVPRKKSGATSVPETLAISRVVPGALSPTAAANDRPIASAVPSNFVAGGTSKAIKDFPMVWSSVTEVSAADEGVRTRASAGNPCDIVKRLSLGGADDEELAKPF